MNERTATAMARQARHFPKIRGGISPPGWLIEHTARNMHALGPSSELLAE